MNLREDFIEWLEGYLAKEDATGLGTMLAHKAYRHSKMAFGVGIFVGIGITILLLKYFA